MKLYKLLLLSAAFLISASRPLTAQVAPDEGDADKIATYVSVEMQCITLPSALARPLIKALRSSNDAVREKAITQLDGLVDAGRAKIVGWPVLTCRDGETATHEEFEEVRYPTQWLSGGNSVLLRQNDGKLQWDKRQVVGRANLPLAFAFDSKEVGITLSVRCTVQPAGAAKDGLKLDIAAKHVWRTATDQFINVRKFRDDTEVKKATQDQPRFMTMNANTSRAMKSGQHALVGVFKVPMASAETELFVLGAEIVEIN